MIAQIKKKITQIKITKAIIYLLFINALLLSSLPVLAFEWDEEPRLKTPKINPYSYDPTNKYRPPTKVDRLKRPIVNVAPQTPAVITDADGNKLLYQNGKLRLKLDPEGNRKYYISNLPRFDRDFAGSLTRRYKYHSPKASVENEFGEVIGYQEFGKGGKLLKEYDKDGTLIRSYIYDGKRLDWAINEITKVKTKYGIYGPEYELSFNGSRIAEYIRNTEGKLLQKLEYTSDENGNIIPGNRTIFDEKGRNPLCVLDYQGNVIATYKYGANERLESITDQYGNVKIYGKYGVLEERDIYGNLLVSHTWKGTVHVSSFNHSTKETTYYKVGDFKQSDPYQPDYVLNTQDMKVRDYIYFSEIKDMTATQIRALLNSTEEDAKKIFEAVQALVTLGKSFAGLSLVAHFEMTGNDNDGNSVYAYNLEIFDEYSKLLATIALTDPNPNPY